jgi:hypothetical protein
VDSRWVSRHVVCLCLRGGVPETSWCSTQEDISCVHSVRVVEVSHRIVDMSAVDPSYLRLLHHRHCLKCNATTCRAVTGMLSHVTLCRAVLC